jgi:benzoyl-CoA 2,3-dioxygenase component B
MAIDYNERIPNNVNLSDNRRLQRALEAWQPKYLEWWDALGPDGTTDYDVYLRTAISVEPEGWAQYDYVKMPDYRWGIFLTPGEADKKITFGEHKGEPVWQEVPGEYRSTLRRLIVTQGDTEPASVEQQRLLGETCPSLYDLRNLFQVNVEEGRHLWAMVYLLHAYFGRDGREEGEAMLERHSGDPDRPRILGAFNEKTSDWLSFFMFTYFTDRDGKYQLSSLAESGFDPLARTCQFMLTEEGHHMFVGETGVGRVIQKTAELCQELGTDNPERIRAAGGIDLPTLQKYVNFHFSVSVDLFGQETSTNAATYYNQSLKGRFQETEIDDDHRLLDATWRVQHVAGDKVVSGDEPALNAVNERLRDEYIIDCERGLTRWNRAIKKCGVDFEITLPHRAFHRAIGNFADVKATPEGKLVTEADWTHHHGDWLPSDDDRAFVHSLMKRHVEPGEFASWVAPPARGVNREDPEEFEYIRFNG